MLMAKVMCDGAGCGMIIEEKDEEKHVKEKHPNFYMLMEQSKKEGLTKRKNFKMLFKKVKNKT